MDYGNHFSKMAPMTITPQQVQFFETFGYLKLPQAFKNEIDWIISEFEQVFVDRNVVHDGTKRSCVVPFIDQREKLSTLVDHPVIVNAATALLGDDFNYLGGDGNYYSGNTSWHTDGFHTVGKYIKMAFYLDPVRAASGALRVIPGSHHIDTKWEGRHPNQAQELYGIEPKDMPAQVLETDPGDLLIFNHNIMHASFGGSGWRRMFTLNLCRHAKTEAEILDLREFVNSASRFWVTQTHSDLMRKTASPERQRHLQQVIDNEFELPMHVAKCKETMLEPARG
jgi:ectoine hydroxylase-related dioxygenase (phytanoyl-CoA dioxygenase family)